MKSVLGNWDRSVHIALTLVTFPFAIRASGFCKSNNTRASSVCTLGSVSMSPTTHIKARCTVYPSSDQHRFPVPDNNVSWETHWPDYNPVNYTAPSVLKNPDWADPDIGSFSPRFNSLDGPVDRRSHEGDYSIQDGRPLNPRGRTGLNGRGLLGRWGPNHAADPIVTRWKRDSSGKNVFHAVSKRPVLQFVSIKRKDCGEWAIPGGMVDPEELVSLTLQREFSEEALNCLQASLEERKNIHERISKLFSSPGFQVYKGYVDDPRNTDNSWMETVAVNFHDETGDSVSELPLEAGDDAGQVSWHDVDSSQPLYASHSLFLQRVAEERQAHW
ncbi:ADP-ribose pyrophosphatase, mitochondrial [Silurus meridionalis]|uniref:ADP-ribose pyrophosphatase, mitochondrial n=1 Tax=Silurus meridionalis TaxID=175797 RepID=UPI001EEC6091|nr:ADP-ribose pyrophosphatase, mitochondrial [Silurus meridionalis]KAI5097182.1 ADP-ribose pyrophosphatase, mitochondrial precursor [Silurus meridionalis]